MNKLAVLLKQIGSQNSKGGQDTELAHVNPAESRLLKLLGGSGRLDPDTGLRHYDWGGGDDGAADAASAAAESDSGESFGSSDSGAAAAAAAAAQSDTGESFGSWDSGYSDPADAAAAAASEGAFDGGWGGSQGPLNIDEDGSGKGRSTQALGPGGELAGFGQWSQDFGNSLGGYGWSSEKSQDWLTNLLGYDPSKTTLTDVADGVRGSLGFTKGDPNNALATRTEDEITNDMGLSGARSSRSTTTDAARNEYNTMGWRGDLVDNPWSYTDLEGKDNTNWGAIGTSAANALNSPLAATIAGVTGLGPAYGLVNGAVQASRGNYTPGISAIAGLSGVPNAQAGVSTLSSLINGTPGNVVAGLGASYLDSLSPGLGAVLNATGLTGYGARGVNDLYASARDSIQNAQVDGDLSSESSGPSDAMMASYESPSASVGDGGFSLASAGVPASFGGGGGSSDFSDYDQHRDFMGSKKKSRYRRPDSLLALLGGDNAA